MDHLPRRRDSARHARTRPLYPVSSLMIHGVFVNHLPLFGDPYDPASPRPTYDEPEMIAEIRSFFGTGANLQEMYIAPD